LVKSLRLRFPLLFLYLVVKPSTFFRYKNEKKLLKGSLKSDSTSDSILLFTTHKCASTYTTKILGDLAAANDYFCSDIEAYFSLKNIDPRKHFSNQKNRTKIFNEKGFYLGPLRYYYPVENIGRYKKVLVLRDPRDVLTSFYYSKKFSHIVISKAFYEDRKKYENHDIDQFVLEYLPEIKGVYQVYVDQLLNTENCINLPYELMVSDFNEWLDKLTAFLNLKDIPSDLISKLKANEKSVAPTGEQTSHIRSKEPGDYLKKLKPETIKVLNGELKEILSKLNYQQST